MMRRRALLGMAGFGAALAAGHPVAAETANEYTERVSSIAALGLGKGEGASLSVVWLPGKGADAQLPPRSVDLVIFDLAGNQVASKQQQLAPLTGASIDFILPKGASRQSVFGYVFVDEPFEDIFATFEIYDASSGQTKLAFPGTVP